MDPSKFLLAIKDEVSFGESLMSKASPAMLNLAQRLLAIEVKHVHGIDHEVECVVNVLSKLRQPLTKFAGPVGYSSLLSRALALAKAQLPELQMISIQADGSVTGFQNPEQYAAGVEIVAQLLALLAIFIGESLMVTLLLDAWPSESFDKVDLSSEVKS
jgi:hypothetical protein